MSDWSIDEKDANTKRFNETKNALSAVLEAHKTIGKQYAEIKSKYQEYDLVISNLVAEERNEEAAELATELSKLKAFFGVKTSPQNIAGSVEMTKFASGNPESLLGIKVVDTDGNSIL